MTFLGFRFRVWMLSFFIASGRGTWQRHAGVGGRSLSLLTLAPQPCPNLSPAQPRADVSSALLGELPPGLLLPFRRVEELSHSSLLEPSGPGGPWGAKAKD